MPIIKSAKKRVRTAEKAAIRNVKTKRNVKTAVKTFQKAATSGSKQASQALRDAQSAIDIAYKKNVLHKNKAARKKSQLAKVAKANATNKTAKVVTKKTAAKKTVAKKPAAKKKPATKK